MIKTLFVAGTGLEVVERGQGRPLLFLHAGEGLAPERPWLDLLARRYRVIAPWHPGWGNSALLDGMGGRDERDITDMHALPCAEYLKLAWADPAKGEVDFTRLPDGELAAIVRGREAFALYGWKPYMHNPRLKHWLHRIDRPTLLLWGAEDRIVTPAYGESWRRAIPNARLELIASAGHFPHWEQPEAFVDKLTAFVEGNR